jgi:hypothetical protein
MAKPISQLGKEIEKFIKSVVTKDLKILFAQRAADTIYKRTKSGKGLTQNRVSVGNNSLKSIDSLSPGYVEYRKTRILGPFASPRRSNLTFSGELLESIIVKVTGENVTVEIDKGQHYSGISLEELAQRVSDKGRPFFGLADSEVKILEGFVKRTIRDRIRKLQRSI